MQTYRAKIKVVLLHPGGAVDRRDLHFTIIASEPSTITKLAKKQFVEDHGPDLVVRTCCLTSRSSAVLYCEQKKNVRRVAPKATFVHKLQRVVR